MKHWISAACAALGLMALAAPAQAHRAWIAPSAFVFSGDEQWATFDAASSNDLFIANHRPMQLDNLSVLGPDGAPVSVANASVGQFRSVWDLKLDKQGTYRVASAGMFYNASWEENGERRRQRGSLEDLRAAGLVGREGVQIQQSARRIETYVTLGAPSDAVFRASGIGLELAPVTHPNDIYAGEEARFRLLLDGRPASGVEVEIVQADTHYQTTPQSVTVSTGADGSFGFTAPTPGRYWLEASTRGTMRVDGVEMPRQAGYALTFEAVAP